MRILHCFILQCFKSLVILISVCLAIYQAFKIQYICTFRCAGRSCCIFSIACIVSIIAITASRNPKFLWSARDIIFFRLLKPKRIESFQRNYWWHFKVYSRKIIKFCLKRRYQNEASCLPFSQAIQCQPPLRRIHCSGNNIMIASGNSLASLG